MCIACWVMFMLLLSSADNNFRNTIRLVNGFDPDQARCYVGPDLGPNCLQRILADDKKSLLAVLVEQQSTKTSSNAANTEPHNVSNYQQRINNNRTAAFERFALDYFVVKEQKMFRLHGGYLTIAIYHHRETI